MSLLFTPTITSLSKHLYDAEQIVIIIAPFISKSGLESFLSELPISKENFKVITRWRAEDLCSGVSDPEIYPVLKKLGAELFLHDHIHLKVFISSLNRAYVGSSNITLTGLGLAQNSNIEAGSINHISRGDWETLFDVINMSRVVDDGTYEIAREYCNVNKMKQKHPPLNLPEAPKNKFLVSQLPSVASPEFLFQSYSSTQNNETNDEDQVRILHDLNLFNIPADLNEKEFFQFLRVSFKANPFTHLIIDQIKESGSLSFGRLTAFVHNKSQDVPLPYRSEVKELVVILYKWIPVMCEEITVSVPGRHSQVLSWGG
jgi:hypothetical protein